ncbi:MAG: type II secretion system protein [Candidatus Campbellbacteria bacterium]|nr:type II secretion system protein [Candidatus Campbellbacteria bacterium]
MFNDHKGFTLVEILVVVGILGLLASVVYANLGGARQSANDARRISDVTSISDAFEMYYARNREFPGAGKITSSLDNNWNSSYLAQELVPTYMSTMPTDPINGSAEGDMQCTDCAGYHIAVNYSGDGYKITTFLSDDDHPEKDGNAYGLGPYFSISKNCGAGSSWNSCK